MDTREAEIDRVQKRKQRSRGAASRLKHFQKTPNTRTHNQEASDATSIHRQTPNTDTKNKCIRAWWPKGFEPTLREACLRGYPEGASCVQRFDDSLNSAIRITYRISLRSSSVRQPRYPLPRVVSRSIKNMEEHDASVDVEAEAEADDKWSDDEHADTPTDDNDNTLHIHQLNTHGL